MQRLLMPSVNKAPSLDTDVVSKFFIDSKGNDHNFHTVFRFVQPSLHL